MTPLEQAAQDYWAKSTHLNRKIQDPTAKQTYLATAIVPVINASADKAPERSRLLSKLLR